MEGRSLAGSLPRGVRSNFNQVRIPGLPAGVDDKRVHAPQLVSADYPEGDLNYVDWNNAITQHFFNPQAADRPVYLYVTQDLVNLLGRAHGKGLEDFISQVLDGPPWITDGRLSLCGTALRTFEGWQNDRTKRASEYPPYIAYLALFVLAAGVDGDFAPHAYYPRLHKLLREDEHAGMPSVFDRMWELWIDLEEWSQSDRNGELGVFDFNISGDWQHVGIPIAQTLLSESDRHNLPRLFSDYALDPNSPPPDAEFLALLRDHSDGILQRRTRRILTASEGAARRALVYAVASELEHWDGIGMEAAGTTPSVVSAILRLCCQLDATASSVQIHLRCKSKAAFPESGLDLTSEFLTGVLHTEEHGFGWSTQLIEQQSYSPFDASALDWSHPVEFHDTRHHWRAVMQAGDVRLFENASSVGLPGYVETARIAQEGDYLILARQHLDDIRLWGKRECASFSELEIANGLPDNWRLFSIRDARNDTLIRDIIPRLALPSSIRVEFRGGITSQDGTSSRFFSFARPIIVIDGPSDSIIVKCNDDVLDRDNDFEMHYTLPDSLPLNETIRIEVAYASGKGTRKTLLLVDTVFTNWQTHQARFGPVGQRLLAEAVGAIGARVDTQEVSFDFARALVPLDSRKAYVIGTVPGQISESLFDPLRVWTPAWVVLKDRRRGRVVPCMLDPAAAAPSHGRTGSPAAVRLWKKVVSFSPKRFIPPPDAEFAALWNRYREAARNVR